MLVKYSSRALMSPNTINCNLIYLYYNIILTFHPKL